MPEVDEAAMYTRFPRRIRRLLGRSRACAAETKIAAEDNNAAFCPAVLKALGGLTAPLEPVTIRAVGKAETDWAFR